MTSTSGDVRYKLRSYQSNLEPDLRMAMSIQDQQRVFLAFRALFEGPNASIRQPKAIRRMLETHQQSSSPLIQNLGFETVVSVLKGLLEKGIFASELKAKLAFPILYETSPEQDALHEASDAGAAREEAEALQEVEALDVAVIEEAGDNVFNFRGAGSEESPRWPSTIKQINNTVPIDQGIKTDHKSNLPSLYPVQFPFALQHSVLAKSQKLLEECCYEFTGKHAEKLLNEKNWDCAEAIELNKWTMTMVKTRGKLPAGTFKATDPQLSSDLLAVNRLRHSAVHRLRISAKGTLQMINSAVMFAQTLSDPIRALQLEELSNELQSKIKSQELNKNFLETKLKEQLGEIDRKRKDLERQEQQAISTMLSEDKDNMNFVGSLLEDKLDMIFPQRVIGRESREHSPSGHCDGAEAEMTDRESFKTSTGQESESTEAIEWDAEC